MTQINGQIIDKKSKKGVGGLKVEAWDLSNIYKNAVVKCVTNASGGFRLTLSSDALRKIFGLRRPRLYFKVYQKDKFLLDTRDAAIWDTKKPKDKVTIPVALASQIPFKFDVFKINAEGAANRSAENKVYITDKLNSYFRKEIVNSLGESSDKLKKAVLSLDMDYTAVKGKDLRVVVNDYVLPALEENPDVKDEISKKDIEKVTGRYKCNVDDLLYLAQPIEKNPVFALETRRLKILELARIAKIGNKEAEMLVDEEIPAVNMGDEDWSMLVKKCGGNPKYAKPLKIAFEAANLTGDNFKLIEKLPIHKLKSSKDLVRIDKDYLLKTFRANAIETPNGEKPQEYVDNIMFNIEHTYPSEFFMHRIVEKDKKKEISLIKDIEPLFKRNKVIFKDKGFASINWIGIGPASKKRIVNGLNGLKKLANTYRHLGVADILNDKALSVQARQKAVTDKIENLNIFYKNNPDIDLRFVDFFENKSAPGSNNNTRPLEWKGISPGDRPLVKRQLMAYQRLFRISPRYEISEELLGKGFDNSFDITGISRQAFCKKVNLKKAESNAIYEKSMRVGMEVAHTGVNVIDNSIDNMFTRCERALWPNTQPELMNALKEIEGYDALFGSRNFCRVEHCQSIFGPAAYFVDLMHFIETHVSQVVFDDKILQGHSLHLKVRRPDLWEIPLTCENTYTLVPYLEIAIDILERFLKRVLGSRVDIYKKLSELNEIRGDAGISVTIDSFNQPFNLPLEELRIYLGHYQMSLADIYKVLNQADFTLAREQLAISLEELDLITNSASIKEILKLYGNPPGVGEIDVQAFLRYSGINRKELDELIQLEFIRGGREIVIEQEEGRDDIQKYTEKIKKISTQHLDMMHRFIRLWRKLPWTLRELDLILTSLKDAGVSCTLNRQVIVPIASLLEIQRRLNISVEELCSLFWLIPETPVDKKEGLFQRLFPELHKKSVVFRYPPFNPDIPNNKVDENLSDLLAGLGISETQLLHLLQFLESKMELNEKNPTLNHKTISLLYRHALLARALRLPIEDFIHALRLILNPQACYIFEIRQVQRLIDFLSWIKSTPFSISQLWLILKGEETTRDNYRFTKSEITALVKRMQDEEAFIFNSSLFSEIDGISEEDSDKIMKTLERKYMDMVVSVGSNRYRLTEKIALARVLSLHYAGSIRLDKEQREAIKGCLNRYHPESFLPAYLKESFNISEEFFELLLPFIKTGLDSKGLMTLLNTEITEDFPHSTYDWGVLETFINKLESLLLLFDLLEIDADALGFILKHLDIFGIKKVMLTLDNLKVLNIYSRLLKPLEDTKPLHALLLSFRKHDNRFTATDADALAVLLGSDPSLVKSIVDNKIPISANALIAIEDMNRCIDICNTLGINGLSLNLLKKTDYKSLFNASRTIYAGFKSRYEDEGEREKVTSRLRNLITPKKRDALCDYIFCSKSDLQFKDKNDLYSFFLIDVDMEGYVKTSRVKAGISSLQLYIHRCLCNLEQSGIDDVRVSPDLVPSEEWEWRKNYRVWEANRKVFLYPENYIQPELRDNKTPIFKELEDDLLQGDITKETAEKAYIQYLARFAEVAILKIAGSYYHEDTNTLYLFGRTPQEPSQYYYRKYIDYVEWTPWERIDLSIDAPYVSAVIHRGKLFLFWVEAKGRADTKVEGGYQRSYGYIYKIYIHYSYLNESGNWSASQKLDLGEDQRGGKEQNLRIYNKKVYLYHHNVEDEKIVLKYNWTDERFVRWHDPVKDETLPGVEISLKHTRFDKTLDLFNNNITDLVLLPRSQPIGRLHPYKFVHLVIFESSTEGALSLKESGLDDIDKEPELEISLRTSPGKGLNYLTNRFNLAIFNPQLTIVHNKPGDLILQLKDQQFLIIDGQSKGYAFKRKTLVLNPNSFTIEYWDIYSKRNMIRLTTSLPHDLGKKLISRGLDEFLSVETQKRSREKSIGIKIKCPSELLQPYTNPDHIDLKGSYGLYYKELFFHIPFLIANHLNASQRFKEAKYWYEKIFNPTAPQELGLKISTDRNWRYVGFRNLDIEKLKEILTNEEAIAKYREDPFSPHAIARLRLNAYQKAVVMKYIDNLIDWGDYLFTQDTAESINEASMLYILAYDILGKRPVELGKCKTPLDEKMTYAEMDMEKGSEFLVSVENWCNKISQDVITNMVTKVVMSVADSPRGALPEVPKSIIRTYDEVNAVKGQLIRLPDPETIGSPRRDFETSIIKQGTLLAFGIPPNENLLGYWDRVEDRLFKIRNGMNIKGVRRELALFQPPIDPMLLVKGKAAGLSLEDIMASLREELPPYRFVYLIEKARTFAATVQHFGSALLGALEKKDIEELNQIRSVHEQNILKLSRETRRKQIEEACTQWEHLQVARDSVERRITHYSGLIETGLIPEEKSHDRALRLSKIFRDSEAVFRMVGAILWLIPELGSPFAITYGGKQQGAWGVAVADILKSMATIQETKAVCAALRSHFKRRDQEWQFIKSQAEQEYLSVDKQAAAAEIRYQIAQKDYEIHRKDLEQREEVYDFLKDKFTNLGLYNYLSISLTRLYREAYNMAYDMAKKAERAYCFECDDPTPFIEPDNWQTERAGLLSGERLILQLQQMERAYIENNTRDYEITQSFSMLQLDPQALLRLKENGTTEKEDEDFTIPEIAFDLFYPGQYKRRIKSVRLTIPCITGPFTNVGCKLTLVKSWIRKAPNMDETSFINVPEHCSESVATSRANNDGGVFELNFRDERYIPFEGAGAVSRWRLELPKAFRAFDYSSISDVIFHISYTAKDDGAFKDRVESEIKSSLTKYAETHGLFRFFSMKQEFPNEFHRFLHPLGETDAQHITLTIDKKHFPYFLSDQAISVQTVRVLIKFKPEYAFTGSIGFVRGSAPASRGQRIQQDAECNSLFGCSYNISSTRVLFDSEKWTLSVHEERLIPENIEDIGLIFYYYPAE